MALPLAGKHCAVVGATGLIGSRIAAAFASRGAVLSLLGRSVLDAQPRLEPLLTPYAPGDGGEASSSPLRHRFIRLDVAKRDTIKGVFGGRDHTQDDAVGPVDILVNCAGISQTSFLKRTSDEELGDIIDTNLMATMLVCGSGATAYAASKAGVVGFTRALCRELGPRSIRVNALLPGWVASPMWDRAKSPIANRRETSSQNYRPPSSKTPHWVV
ncbi:uncharacterized protein NECHADRAFT_78866 [Fusarium vanettenii 77-13-4]|uniref:Ketoreductase (KR) domain-containing protein n=1 Tax=Fusarium vanettenii (strain ATCC MYA-4622 / CBS 123669 / FGSC 9596 / NRRL 45880 / 77-13-4) TaxID=660122 RepID=C7YPT6_FUSV7|nr:uncharacterized protein NECHADRAFT_78866 [Fusarium vanettenii 77-13-4]EEU45907.1 hypothetical protein NECHADRAFT_78866 [Fusarium vanettenii 77-13-4]